MRISRLLLLVCGWTPACTFAQVLQVAELSAQEIEDLDRGNTIIILPGAGGEIVEYRTDNMIELAFVSLTDSIGPVCPHALIEARQIRPSGRSMRTYGLVLRKSDARKRNGLVGETDSG